MISVFIQLCCKSAIIRSRLFVSRSLVIFSLSVKNPNVFITKLIRYFIMITLLGLKNFLYFFSICANRKDITQVDYFTIIICNLRLSSVFPYCLQSVFLNFTRIILFKCLCIYLKPVRIRTCP